MMSFRVSSLRARDLIEELVGPDLEARARRAAERGERDSGTYLKPATRSRRGGLDAHLDDAVDEGRG
jgi:hypothetical protein